MKKGEQISAGNFIVSIGINNINEVAIISKKTGNFVNLKQSKVSKKLRKIKKEFKIWLNSEDMFTFGHMVPERTWELVDILK